MPSRKAVAASLSGLLVHLVGTDERSSVKTDGTLAKKSTKDRNGKHDPNDVDELWRTLWLQPGLDFVGLFVAIKFTLSAQQVSLGSIHATP